MPTRSLADWLDHQQRQHPQAIALGLERVREVAARLGLMRPAPITITIGGTNGKGSTVAFLEAMLRAAGLRVGAYASPHLLRYNERVRVDGADVADAPLVEAFERIEQARGEVPLTYFEYGTLAALAIFAARTLDVALLEVGLGGRLDAVNLVDADAAAVTTVDLDHQDWLGNEREAIGFEKAGIFRAGRPAIVGELQPPQSLLRHAEAIGARLERAGVAFVTAVGDARCWHWRHRDGTRYELPPPALTAPCQIANAATALAVLHALRERLPLRAEAFARGVATARVRGRLERIAERPEVVVDVAHNPQAASALGAWLRANPRPGPNVAVFGALRDKDVAGIARALDAAIRAWHLVGLERVSARGATAEELDRAVRAAGARHVQRHGSVEQALAAASAQAGADGRVLVFGSFFTVASALRWVEAGNERRSSSTAPL
jgi:dihydrofolate synthase/folylpolyglutamate synthase